MPKITKRIVDAAHPKADRYMIWDSELRGFGLLVMPSGVKSYRLDYRTPDGLQRRITIGRHGDFTAEEARRKAEDFRKQVRDGGDPLGMKEALREAATIGDVLDAYLASDAFGNKAPITRDIDRGRIERHLRPLLGKKHAHLLTRQEVTKASADIERGKTAVDVKTGPRGRARVRGGPGAARMAITVLKVILNWAVTESLIAANPVRSLKVGAHGKRTTILEGADDYARLFATLAKMERERRIREPVADAIRLIALTGCRRGEAANLKWAHVNLKEGKLEIPAHSHKTGKKTGEARVIDLPAAAQAVIADQPDTGPDDYVFAPAKGEGGALDLTHAWTRVRDEAKLPPIGLHGLRHSHASHLAMAGGTAPEIMQALGHRNMATSAKYVHWASNARQVLAERAAATALAGMAAATKKPGKVVKLKASRRRA